MLCCALGLAAVATIPAWRKALLATGRYLVLRDAALLTTAIVTAAITMFAAHTLMHRDGGPDAMAMSSLCIAPSLKAADLRLADRPARRSDGQIF
jgi:hypothetical protein